MSGGLAAAQTCAPQGPGCTLDQSQNAAPILPASLRCASRTALSFGGTGNLQLPEDSSEAFCTPELLHFWPTPSAWHCPTGRAASAGPTITILRPGREDCRRLTICSYCEI